MNRFLFVIFTLFLGFAGPSYGDTIPEHGAPGVELQTSEGAVFRRVDGGPLDPAWVDVATGLIWGNRVAGDQDHAGAEEICQSLGARLPSRQEFHDLRLKMGHGTPGGYQPQILPGLVDQWLWSRTLSPYHGGYAYQFHGSTGKMARSRARSGLAGVLCVIEAH